MSLDPITTDVPWRRDWQSRAKRLGWGLLIGATVTALPWLVSKLDMGVTVANFLLMPGTIVALIFSGWKVHTYDPSLLIAANVVCYTGLIYVFLSVRDKWKRSNRNHPSSHA